MCGRFVISYTYDELIDFLEGDFTPFEVRHQLKIPDYNVCPSKDIVSIIFDGQKYRVGNLKWGYKPFERFKYPLANARSEVIDEKPMYRHSFHSRRCVIVASGFYEWKTIKETKQPYYIQRESNTPMLFAGIYTKTMSKLNQPEYTTAIITTNANQFMNDIHERMPVILDIEEAIEWLNGDIDKSSLKRLFNRDLMELSSYKVSSRVNNTHNNGVENIEKV